jgi:hypothetical protein
MYVSKEKKLARKRNSNIKDGANDTWCIGAYGGGMYELQ